MKALTRWEEEMILFFIRQTNTHEGCSLSVKTGEQPSDGYMVGIGKERSKGVNLTKRCTKALTFGDVEYYYKENKHLLEKPNHYLGSWIHEGRVYLDVSVRVSFLEQAMHLAVFHGEKAVWDVKLQEEVLVGD
jgi:hypothetical protein